MTISRRSVLISSIVAAGMQFGGLGFAFADTSLLNVSYDPTRELYKEFNAAFAAKWKAETGAASVILETKTDSALLGGFILRAGSVRYDWSTAGRIGRLGRELARPADASRE